MGSAGHEIQRCCFLRPHLENTGFWRCSTASPGVSLGTVCAGGGHSESTGFLRPLLREEVFALHAGHENVFFVMSTRVRPLHLCSVLGEGQQCLLRAILHLLMLTGAAGFGLFTHQGRGVSGKRLYGRLGLDMSPLPAVSGLSWQTLSNNVTTMAYFFSQLLVIVDNNYSFLGILRTL